MPGSAAYPSLVQSEWLPQSRMPGLKSAVMVALYSRMGIATMLRCQLPREAALLDEVFSHAVIQVHEAASQTQYWHKPSKMQASTAEPQPPAGSANKGCSQE